jgi:hypothetical protein
MTRSETIHSLGKLMDAGCVTFSDVRLILNL